MITTKNSKLTLFSLALLSSVYSIGQEDTVSSDIPAIDTAVYEAYSDAISPSITDTDVVFTDTDDSILHIGSGIRELIVSFEIPDLEEFEAVLVEVSIDGRSTQLLYNKSFTKGQLESAAFISDTDVSIKLGRYQPGFNYHVNITLVHAGGALGQTITNTYGL